MGGAEKAFSGPAHVTAFTTVFHGITRRGPHSHMIKVPQPLSQPSKDVGRFHVATSRPQVAITGQQETLNKPRIFCNQLRIAPLEESKCRLDSTRLFVVGTTFL